jgi:asparagine synthase (glutamine-hydrolysing)
MCGIAGVITVGSVVPEALPSALTALAHRGPDGDGIEAFDAPGVRGALGHRRLAILDLSPAGRQPMASPDGRTSIVYNGEIYDYLERKAELAALGHTFRTRTDTEVLLAAWKQWGPEMLPRLNGMFALALAPLPRAGPLR